MKIVELNSLTMISSLVDVSSVHQVFHLIARTTHTQTLDSIMCASFYPLYLSLALFLPECVRTFSISMASALSKLAKDENYCLFKRHIKENVIYEG